MEKLLTINDLSVSFGRGAGELKAVTSMRLQIEKGQIVALVGESGSGKTVTALSVTRLLPYPLAWHPRGSIKFDSQELMGATEPKMRAIRGNRISMIFQEPLNSLNPLHSVEKQIKEVLHLHKRMSDGKARERVEELLDLVGMPEASSRLHAMPHEFSGGQQQRFMIAMALANEPELLIADEPTTALDVTTQIEVLQAFKKLIRDKHTSAIYVSHDLAVVAQVADDILVLKDGEMIEYGPVDQIIHEPSQDYTRELISAAHVMPKRMPEIRTPTIQTTQEDVTEPLLVVDNVTAGYGPNHQHLVLHSVSIEAHAGRTIGIIGESGSGKTTLGRVISGLMGCKQGEVRLGGMPLAGSIGTRSRDELRSIQFAFQMADVALNPRHRIRKILGRPLKFYFKMSKGEADHRVDELLDTVELPASFADRFPRELSGGERQRINLARSLTAEPKLMICDEITSALDTIVAEAILKLLRELQERLKIAYVFISHDLSTISKVADTIAVMRDGKIVEYGSTVEILTPPHHNYTELLLSSVPELRTDWLDGIEAQRTTAPTAAAG